MVGLHVTRGASSNNSYLLRRSRSAWHLLSSYFPFQKMIFSPFSAQRLMSLSSFIRVTWILVHISCEFFKLFAVMHRSIALADQKQTAMLQETFRHTLHSNFSTCTGLSACGSFCWNWYEFCGRFAVDRIKSLSPIWRELARGHKVICNL